MSDQTYPLLGDLSQVPLDYQVMVAEVKRFLERFIMDPKFRSAYEADSSAALRELGLSLKASDLDPFFDQSLGEQMHASPQHHADAMPLPVRAHWAFTQEKLRLRARMRERSSAADPALARWRKRQVNRTAGELGADRADAIVHAPFAVELSKGCTVGCWFCGVAAPKFDHNFPHTSENGALWRGILTTMSELMGPAAQEGFLYWATDPLDNPDYELFRRDFYDIIGRAPQTTTAQGPKDIGRTKALLAESPQLEVEVDRFSIIALNHLYRLHDAFTPLEMLRVECVPQNKEAQHVKSRSGRALQFADKRAEQLVDESESSTIACVSGFLFNLVDRTVRLITPCNTSDRWPLGYWILDEAGFDTADDLAETLRAMIQRSVTAYLTPATCVRTRPDIRLSLHGDNIVFEAMGAKQTARVGADAAEFFELLAAGSSTAEDFALARWNSHQVPLAATYALLGRMFDLGLLDEEPPARSFADVMRGPTPLRLSRRGMESQASVQNA